MSDQHTHAQNQVGVHENQEDEDDLFSFVTDNFKSQTLPSRGIEYEVEAYLCDPDISTRALLKYPCLLEAFLKFNAALPSSAAVERLFSCAGQILVPRRCKLSDKMFEKLVFLRYKMKSQGSD